MDKEIKGSDAEKAQKNIPTWIKEGNEYIYPELKEDWESRVGECAKDYPYGYDVQIAIDIMKMLNSGATMEDVKKKLEEKNVLTGYTAKKIHTLVLYFAKNGPEFYKYICGDEMGTKQSELFAAIEKRNAEYQNNRNADDDQR